MANLIFQANMKALRTRDPVLYDELSTVVANQAYTGIVTSRSGHIIPVSGKGRAYHSLYDPLKEAGLLVDTLKADSFVVFAGIGGAFHIRAFLSRFPDSCCAIVETGRDALRSLLQVIDIADLIENPHVSIIPDGTDGTLASFLPSMYLPAINGDFRLLALRSWQEMNSDRSEIIEQNVKKAVASISSDFSVQAHFGRLWLRNCLLNIQLAALGQGKMPVHDLRKTAVIAAAGPGLEDRLPDLAARRDSYVIITTDTAYGTLIDSGIIPDIFVSIDAQAVSAAHAMHAFHPSMTVVLEICGNSGIARRAREAGANLIFAAGGHPLAQYLSGYSRLPPLDTGSGTVTIAALDIANALGFQSIELTGADFAYRNGKPYARGTYLADTFDTNSGRNNPSELLYSALMFRTPVSRVTTATGITYKTETLNRYAQACDRFMKRNHWTAEQFENFPADRFLKSYRKAIIGLALQMDRNDPVLYTLLPFFAWVSTNKTRGDKRKNTGEIIQLALELIAGYTE